MEGRTWNTLKSPEFFLVHQVLLMISFLTRGNLNEAQVGRFLIGAIATLQKILRRLFHLKKDL